MKRIACFLLSGFALILLAAPSQSEAQDRFAFGFLSGASSANDGLSFLTVNSTALNTTNRGKYFADGGTDANTNFKTGAANGALESRGFYLFNLANFSTTTITSASLSLFNCSTAPCGANGYLSPNPSETVNIYDFTGSVANLVGGIGGLALFGDLGTGSIFGTQSVSAADNGQFVTFTFNAAGLAALNSARGNQFAVGSALQVNATTTPEPATTVLLGVGLLFVSGVFRRRRNS